MFSMTTHQRLRVFRQGGLPYLLILGCVFAIGLAIGKAFL